MSIVKKLFLEKVAAKKKFGSSSIAVAMNQQRRPTGKISRVMDQKAKNDKVPSSAPRFRASRIGVLGESIPWIFSP